MLVFGKTLPWGIVGNRGEGPIPGDVLGLVPPPDDEGCLANFATVLMICYLISFVSGNMGGVQS